MFEVVSVAFRRMLLAYALLLSFLLAGVNAAFPTLSTLTSTSPAGVYVVGSTVSLSLNFGAAVTLLPCPAGNPTLMLNVASSPYSAVYTGGNGTTSLTFTYTPVSGDFTPVGSSLDVQSLNGVPQFITNDLNGPYQTSPLIFPLNSNCQIVDTATKTFVATPSQLALPTAGALKNNVVITVVDPILNLTLSTSFTTTSVTNALSGYKLKLVFTALHDPHFSWSDAYNVIIASASLWTGQNSDWALWLEPASFSTSFTPSTKYTSASAASPNLAMFNTLPLSTGTQSGATLTVNAWLNCSCVPAFSLFFMNVSLTWSPAALATSVYPTGATRTIWNSATLPLGVATNQPPTFDGPLNYTMVGDQVLYLNDQTLNDPDFYTYYADGLMNVTISCTSGTISIAPGYFNSLLFTSGSATNVTSMTFTSPIEQARAAVRGLLYYATYMFNNTVTLFASDNANSGVGGIRTVTKLLTITTQQSNTTSLLLYAPYSMRLLENTNITMSALSMSDPFLRTSFIWSVTLSVTAGNISAVAGANNVATLVGTTNSPWWQAVQWTGTLAQLNTQFKAMLYTPLPNVNEWSDVKPVMSIQINDPATPSLVTNFSWPMYVTAVNVGPTLSLPYPNITVNESTPFYIGGITFGDNDYEEDVNGQLYVELQVYHGKLSLNTTSGLTILAIGTLADGTDGFYSKVYTSQTQASYYYFLGDLASIGWAVSYGITYVPDRFYNGSDVLRVAISDQGFSGTNNFASTNWSYGTVGPAYWANGTIPITVVSWNNPPFVTGPSVLVQPLAMTENVALVVNFGFVDQESVEGYGGIYTVTVTPTNGIITFSSSLLNTVTLLLGNGYNDTITQFNATYTNARNFIQAVTFSPDYNFNGGNAALGLRVQDDGTGGLGGPQSGYWNVTFNIAAVNQAPTVYLAPGQWSCRSWESLYLGQSIFIDDMDVNELAEGMLHITLSVTTGALSLNQGFEGLNFASYSTGTNDTTMEFWSDLYTVSQALTTLVYYPSATYSGYTPSAIFTATVDDMGYTGIGGTLSATASTTITVTLVDRPLVISMPNYFNGTEDTAFPLPGIRVYTLDPDASSKPATIMVNLTTRFGTLTWTSNPGVSVVYNGVASRSVAFTGSIENVQSVLNSVYFQASLNGNDFSNGPDTLIVSTSYSTVGIAVGANTLGFSTGSVITSTLTRVVSVTPVNDAPTIAWLVPPVTSENTELRFKNLYLDDVDIQEDFTGRLSITVSVQYGLLRMYSIVGCMLIKGTMPWVYTRETQEPTCMYRNATQPWSYFLCQNQTFGDSVVSVDCNRDSLAAFTASLSYVPPLGFVGIDTVNVTVNDRGYTGSSAGVWGANYQPDIANPNTGLASSLSAFNTQPIVVNILPITPPFLYWPTPLIGLNNLTQVPGVTPSLAFVEDVPTMVLLQLISWEGVTANFTLTVAVQTGTLQLVTSTVPVGLGNASTVVTIASLPPATGLGQGVAATTLTISLFSVPAYATVSLNWLYTPTVNWNSGRRGQEYFSATATNSAGGLAANPAAAQVRVTVLAQNDGPMLNVSATNAALANYSLYENNLLLVNASVYDVDLWEGVPDGLLYFQLVLQGGHGNVTLNSTAGLSYLSDIIMPYIQSDQWRTITADPVQLPLQLTTSPPYLNPTKDPTWLMTVGSPNLAGYGTAEAITRALTNLRYTPTINYFGTESLLISISDRGQTTSCLSPQTNVMPSNYGGGTTFSTFATSIDASWALTQSLFGSSKYGFNQYFNGTTHTCSGPWLWSNATIGFHIIGVNHAPIINFTTLQLPGINQATLTEPPTFWTWEDTIFSIPPLFLVDREQSLSACANDLYNLTFTINYGWISIVPVAGSADATALTNGLQYLIGGPGSFSVINNTVLKVQGTLPTLNIAVKYLQYLPWTNYRGLQSSVTLTLQDDGCAAVMGAGSASSPVTTFLTIWMNTMTVNDAPIINLPNGTTYEPDGIPVWSVPGISWVSTMEDTAFFFSAAQQTAWSVFDVDIKDTQGALFHCTISVSNGTISFISDWNSLFNMPFSVSGLHFVRGDGRNNTVMEFFAEYETLNKVLAMGLQYQPNVHFNGYDLMVFQLDDQGNSGVGGTLSTMKSVVILTNATDTNLTLTVPILFNGIEDVPFQLKPISLSSIDTINVNVTANMTVWFGWLSVTNSSWTSVLNITQLDPFFGTNPLYYGQTLAHSLSISGTLQQMIEFLQYSSVTYTAPVHWNGYDDFFMTVSYPSQTGNTTQPIVMTWPASDSIIKLSAINDAPVLTVNRTMRYVMQDGDDLLFEGQPISVYDLDLDEQASLGWGMLLLNLTASHGTLSLAGLAGLQVTSGTHPSHSFVVEGSIADLNASLASLRYKPDPHYYGMDTILIGLSDQGFTGAAPTESSVLYTTGTELGPLTPLSTNSSIPVNVTYFNWPPVQPLRYDEQTNEDTPLLLQPFNFTHVNHPPVVTTYQVDISVQHGTLACTATLAGTVQMIKNGSVYATGVWNNLPIIVPSASNIAPTSNQYFWSQFLTSSHDGTAVGLNQQNTLTLVSSDTASLFAALASVVYTPFPHYNGPETITFNVTDQNDPVSWSNNVTNLLVVAVNDAPTLAFFNTSYVQRAFQVAEAVPTMLPTVLLDDVDAPDSPIIMTLTVTSLYGKLQMAAPFDLGRSVNLQPSAAGTSLKFQGSLAQLKQWVNAVQFTSALIADPVSGVNTLFPAFDNDTIVFTVSDGGASGLPVLGVTPTPLIATLTLTIDVQPAPNAPTIVTSLGSPIMLTEDATYSFLASTLSLSYVDGDLSSVLHTTLTLSGEAATYGMRLQVGGACTLSMVLAQQDNIRKLTTTTNINNVTEANVTGTYYASPAPSAYSLTPSNPLVYTMYGALAPMSQCLSALQIVPAPNYNGLLFEALTIVVDDQGLINSFDVPGQFGVLSRIQAWDLLVQPVNDMPVIFLASTAVSVPAMQTLAVTAQVQFPNVTIYDLDINLAENFYGPLMLTVSVTAGSLDVARGAPVAGVSVISGSLQRSARFQIVGMPSALNQALAATYYVAPWYACTTDTIWITINDQGNFGCCSPLSSSAFINVTVTC